MKGIIRNFLGDQRGNVALFSAACLSMALGCAALGVDVGKVFTDRRKLQSTTDLAALVAAADINNATAAATATAQKNSYAANSVVSVERGLYAANPAVAPGSRFTPSNASNANAVRVTLQAQSPLVFGKIITGQDNFSIRTTATATTTGLASFAVGSRLVSLNGGLLNALLGGMLGTTLSLSVMDYQNLLDTKIDAFDFMSALATRIGATAVSYSDLLATDVKLPDVLQAMKSANGSNAATTALNSVVQAVSGSTAKVNLASLVDPGPYSSMQVGQKPKVGVQVAAYDLLSAAAELANGKNQVAANVNLGLPGIASVALQATIGERPQGTSWMTVGSQGATVHTAQTRVYLNIQLLNALGLVGVTLPIYIEVAAATATLNQVSCGYPNVSTSTVTLGVKPGIVDAWIGAVTPAQMTNFSSAPNPGPATILQLPLITVTGTAHATMANPTAQNVVFSYADIQAQTKKTVNTNSFLGSLTSSLLGDLDLKLTLIGLGLPIPGLLNTVANVLAAVTTPVDTLLSTVLSTLGIGLGQADTWVTGIRCDGAVLVN
jgi:uncharacterized membrane protein